MKSIAERLEEIAEGCDDCAADAHDEATKHNAVSKAEARAWRATASMIRDVIKDLKG